MKTTKNTSTHTQLKKAVFAAAIAALFIMAGCGTLKDNTPTKQSESQKTPEIMASWDQNSSMGAGMSAVNESPANESEDDDISLTSAVNEVLTTDNNNSLMAASAESVNIVMVGDILLHTPLEELFKQPDGSYDYAGIFTNTKAVIQNADLALVNQEVIIGGEELGVSGYPCFNAPYSIGDELVETGFDVICHGTNHAMDKGRKGITNCLDFWQTNYPDISVLGIYNSMESRDSVYIYEKNGIKIAILNYTYGTNGIELPSDMPFAVNLLKESQVRADIQYAEANADFTIVCPHWGTEYRLTADSMQQKWTNIFLEEGVDLVLGTHPHVIEPIEMVTDENTGHEMLVYYSLGNFINWTSSSGAGVANRMVGGMSDVTLFRDDDGLVKIRDYQIHALVCHLTDETNGPTTYFLSDYSPELARNNSILSQDSNFSYDYCMDLCNEVWGAQWN